MSRNVILLGSVFALLTALPGATRADNLTIVNSGTGLVSGLTDGSPGAAVSIDYTSSLGGPYDAKGATLTLDTSGVYFSSWNVQLSSGETYSFASVSGVQGYVNIYDPAWLGPGNPGLPEIQMDDAWRNELADGSLDCHIWVEGVSYGVPGGFSMGARTVYRTPEPATLALLALGALAMLRRRR